MEGELDLDFFSNAVADLSAKVLACRKITFADQVTPGLTKGLLLSCPIVPVDDDFSEFDLRPFTPPLPSDTPVIEILTVPPPVNEPVVIEEPMSTLPSKQFLRLLPPVIYNLLTLEDADR